MHYNRSRGKPYQSKSIKENPELKGRLEKIKKEDLDNSTKSFIDSLSEFFDRKGGLTDNQLGAFQKIESRFSPHEKAKFELWKKEYLKSHAVDTKIVAKYYARSGYYTTLANKILEDENFIPSKQDYKRMVKNNYAAKVLDATRTPPKFAKDAMVQIRSTAGNTMMERHMRQFQSRLCFVLANDLSIVNATAGAKRYKVLPMGGSQPIEIDEKHLMKPNKKGKYS